MRGAVLLLLTVALVSGPAWAKREDESVSVTFHTRPEGLRVYKVRETELDYLGFSSSTRSLSMKILSYDREVVRFLILPPGQEPPKELGEMNLQLVPTDALKAKQRFPIHGEYVLDQDWKQRLSQALRGPGALWLLLIPVLAGLVAGWVRSRKQVARQAESGRDLDRLRAETFSPGDPIVGSVVGGYLIEGILGKGGMAVVYRAIPLASPDQVYALKLLHITSANDESAQKRFEREIALTSQLVHPNIVPVVDFGHHQGLPFLVMVVVEGTTMAEKVQPEGLRCQEVLSLLEPVFSAIAYAHKKGIVHRDLKPDNLMLTRHLGTGNVRSAHNQHVLVTDFGLSRRGNLQSLTVTGQVLGTPNYMAPEQIEGNSVPATDQYALGIIVFELLTGQYPFLAENPMQMLFAHLSKPPRSLTELRPELPQELAEVVSKMLAKKPEQRFADLDEALHALRHAMRAAL